MYFCACALPGSLRFGWSARPAPWAQSPGRVGCGSVGLSPGWLPPVRVGPPVPPRGPNPRAGSGVAPSGCAQGARTGPGPGVCPASVLLPVLPAERKAAEDVPPPFVCPALSLSDSVIYIPVLDHAVCGVVCDDDMIEDQYPDALQESLKLNR